MTMDDEISITMSETVINTSICIHCGLPVRNKSHMQTENVYCCYGCEIAHHLLGTPGDEASARLALIKLGAGVLIGINVMMFSMPLYVESLGSFFRQGFGAESFFELLKYLLMALSIPVFFLLGTPFIESAVRSIKDGLRSNTDLLIAIGVTAALLLSIFNTVFVAGPVYYETAVAILVIVTAGRYLEAKSRARASRAVDDLEKNIPKTVICFREGEEVVIEISELKAGDNILIKPGGIIPVDSVISIGSANIGEAMLTGEPTPLFKKSGDELLSGSINYDGVLYLEVLRQFKESFITRLETLLLESKIRRAKIQVVSDKISEIAVPVIITVAIGSFFYWSFTENISHGLFAFLSVVLVACPCALGIATPAALWIAVTEASKRGILFRSLEALERLSTVKTIFFDKTGTLTVGKPQLRSRKLNPEVIRNQYVSDEMHLLSMIREVVSYSNHPLSQTLAAALPKNGFRQGDVTEFIEFPSKGISAKINGVKIKIGTNAFTTAGVSQETESDTSVWCSVMREDGLSQDAVLFIFADEVRSDAKKVFTELHTLGYETMILSGDHDSVAVELGDALGSEAIGGLSPKDKVKIVSGKPNTVFIGDGLNDAGAIGAAQIGIAMGHGSDLIRREADVILFDTDLERIPQTLQLASKTMRIVRQNLFWAFAYNVVGVVFAAAGMLNPIIAALAMALSSLAVTQNSLRLHSAMDKEAQHA
jgi:Cu+-exporting ATPase